MAAVLRRQLLPRMQSSVIMAKYVVRREGKTVLSWPGQIGMKGFIGASAVRSFSSTSCTSADTPSESCSSDSVLWQGPTLSYEFDAAWRVVQASKCITLFGTGLGFLGVSSTMPPIVFSIGLLLASLNVHFFFVWQARLLRFHLRRNVIEIEQASLYRGDVDVSIICDGGVSHDLVLTLGPATGQCSLTWARPAPQAYSKPSLAQILKFGQAVVYLNTDEGMSEGLQKLLEKNQGVRSDELQISALPLETESELAMVRKQIRFDTITSELIWSASERPETTSPKENFSLIVQVSKVVAAVAFCGGAALFLVKGRSAVDTQFPKERTIRAVEYTDGDGDTTRFSFENGKLIQYVNGRRKVGKGDNSGVVTRLMWSTEGSREGSGGFIGDQYGWGAEIPAGQLEPLRRLADRAGVHHNIPN